MASSSKSSAIEILIDEVKTLMIRIYTLKFETDYDSLYTIAFDAVNDAEAAKNILDEILNETILSILESGFKLFQPDEIKKNFKLRINEYCQKYIDEIDAEREFQIIHGQTIHLDNSRDEVSTEEEIILAALEAVENLSPARKKLLYETLQSGSTPRKVAENNKMETKTVLKMNWKTRQILKKVMLGKI